MNPGPPPRSSLPSDAFRDPRRVHAVLTGNRARDEENLRRLLDTIAQVSVHAGIDSALASIVDRSLQVTGGERGILLLDGPEGTLQVRVARDRAGHDLPHPVRYSTHIVRSVRARRKAIMQTLGEDAPFDPTQSMISLGTRAVLCVPFEVDGRVEGVVYVDTRAPNASFLGSDLALFDAFARHLGITISNERRVKERLEKERMERALAVARDVQRRFLPRRGPPCPGFEIEGHAEACEETTGDYYDYLPLSGGRFAIVIGDVSGHGIGGALVMTSVRALLRADAERLEDFGVLLARANRFLCDETEVGTFMSLAICLLDPARREIHYANAGHPSPLLLDRGGTLRPLEPTGPALGIDPGESCTVEGPIPLPQDAVLAFYTDGLVEAASGSGERFGADRLHDALRRLAPQPAARICEGLREEVRRFSGRDALEDDCTIVVVRSTG